MNAMTPAEKTIAERIAEITDKKRESEPYAWEMFWGAHGLDDRYNIACRYISRFGGSAYMPETPHHYDALIFFFPDGSGFWAHPDVSGYVVNGRPGQHPFDSDFAFWTNCLDEIRIWALGEGTE